MNLEEKENTAEAAPEAAAQVTIQAVQENNVQEAGVRETAGTAAPQEQPAKSPRTGDRPGKRPFPRNREEMGKPRKIRAPDRDRQRAGPDKRERPRPEPLPVSPRTAPAQGPPREPAAQRHPEIQGSPRRPEIPANQRRFPRRPGRRDGTEERMEGAS